MSEQKVLQAIRLQYLFMSFLGVMVIMHIDLLVQLWIGEEFNSVSQIIKVIIVTFLFPNAGVFLMMYYAKGETKINSIFVTFSALMSLTIGTSILIITNDVMLFAWSFSIVSIIIALLSINIYANYFKVSKLNFLKDTILAPLLIMISYYLIMYNIGYIFNLDLIGLILGIVVSIVIYIVLFLIFMKSEDRELIWKFIKRVRG